MDPEAIKRSLESLYGGSGSCAWFERSASRAVRFAAGRRVKAHYVQTLARLRDLAEALIPRIDAEIAVRRSQLAQEWTARWSVWAKARGCFGRCF
jgi:hypothetical protein